jgi:hypothetical protein
MTVVTPLKGTWIDLEVPENLSYDCARFLLSAPDGVVLTDHEKDVYTAMRRYKLIELNLESTLDVKVPWTPDKTREVGDVKIECQLCHIRFANLLYISSENLISYGPNAAVASR